MYLPSSQCRTVTGLLSQITGDPSGRNGAEPHQILPSERLHHGSGTVRRGPAVGVPGCAMQGHPFSARLISVRCRSLSVPDRPLSGPTDGRAPGEQYRRSLRRTAEGRHQGSLLSADGPPVLVDEVSDGRLSASMRET